MRTNRGLNKITIIILIIASVIVAIKVGELSGNLFYEVNDGMLEKIDTQYFKDIISISLPVIDTVYNSGRTSTFSEDIRFLLKAIFNIEPGMPISFMNAQSVSFLNYFGTHYLPSITAQNKTDKDKLPENQPEENRIEQNNEVIQDKNDVINETEEDKNGNNGFLQAESSISFEEEEKKDIPNSEEISKGKITIYNETNYKINVDELLKQNLKIDLSKKGPEILIFHTHTTESYLPSLKELDNPKIYTCSRDVSKNVVRVGDELAANLERYGLDILHNATVHDYPDYNKSYTNAYKTLDSILKSYPSIKITIDIHRDAVDNGSKLRIVTNLEGKTAAKIMFVVGTDAYGLSNPRWKENLILALKLQQKLNEIAPGLAKHIYITKYRYNQHMAQNGLLVEIGGDGNLMEECLVSTSYLAEAINMVLK